MAIEHAEGPLTSRYSKVQAEEILRSHPAFPKDAEYTMWESGGRWHAAFQTQAGPPFGAPADTDEEAPGPKSEGPDDTAPAPPGNEPGEDKGEGGEDEGEGGEGPPKHEKPGEGKGGEAHVDHEILNILNKIVVALGIDMGPESPVPGEEGPPGPPGPPQGPPGGPGSPDQVTQHQRAMKPGETPPGGTPIGAPAFASVASDHPWAHVINDVDDQGRTKTASFTVQEKWPENRPIGEFEQALSRVAHGTPFKVKQTQRDHLEDGTAVARAFVSRY